MHNDNSSLFVIRFPMFGGTDQMVLVTQLDDTHFRLETTPEDAEGEILAGDVIAVAMDPEGSSATFIRVVTPFPTQRHSFAVKPAALTSDGFRAFEAQVHAEGGQCERVRGGEDGTQDAETLHVTLPRACRLDVGAALEAIGVVSQYDRGLALPPLAPSASVDEILEVLHIATSVFEREWRLAIGCMCLSIGTALLTAARRLAAGVQALEAGIARASTAESLSFERKEREQIRFAIEALENLQPRRPADFVHLTDYIGAIRALIKVYPSLPSAN